MVVAGRYRRPAGDPVEQVLIGLAEQRLVAIEADPVKAGEVLPGELAEQQVAFQPARDIGSDAGAACDAPGAARSWEFREVPRPAGLPGSMAKHVADRKLDSKAELAGAAAPTPPDPLLAWLTPARALKGVGPSLERTLARLVGLPDSGVRRLDLLWHLPHAVVDRRLRPGHADAHEGELVTLEVVVERHQPGPQSSYRPNAALRQPYRVRCRAAAGALQLVFFRARAAYLQQALPAGARRIVSGPLSRFGHDWQIVHPELILTPAVYEGSSPLQPVYPLTQGLSTRVLASLVRRALEDLPELPEWQGSAWLEQRRWPSFKAALERLHQPTTAADVALDAPARQRLAFDELLANQLALALVRRRATARAGRSLAGDGRLSAAVVSALPFRLTAGQRRVLAAIRADMAGPERMLRLLQGDVGSGKTLVAVLAMLTAVEAGGQAAIMAPTEVLARQHQATLARLLAPAGLHPTLLTGRERGAERARRLADIADGESRIVVGTHALFQEGVGFADLALAVIDEQHRFGVHQRLGLAAKGSCPDLLVMTATPIPRTLVLALYGDMVVSELRQKPPGRQPIRTRALPLARLDRIVAAVARALGRGEQLYWVCPLIGSGEPAAEAIRRPPSSAIRRSGPSSGRSSGWCTAVCAGGRKDAGDGELRSRRDPSAGRDHGDRGRGRRGRRDGDRGRAGGTLRARPAAPAARPGRARRRGRRPACCSMAAARADRAAARLQVMRATDDGFRIAEEDLRLRGPGEVLGARQSGLPALRLADLAAHADLLAPARADVRLCLARDPALESPRGRALRQLLRLFEPPAGSAYLGSG